MGVIVVGVDHSEGAKAALQFAVDEAKLRQSTLRAVHAWQFSFETPGIEGGLYPAVLPDLSDCTAPRRPRSKQRSATRFPISVGLL